MIVPVVGDPVTRTLPYSGDLERWRGHWETCPQCAHLGYGAAAPCLAGFVLLSGLADSVAAMHDDALLN